MTYPKNPEFSQPMSPSYRGRPINQDALFALEEALAAFLVFEEKAKEAEHQGGGIEDTIGWCESIKADIEIQINRALEREL